MNVNEEIVIRSRLWQTRSGMSRDGIASIGTDPAAVDRKMDGLTMSAGHVPPIDAALESRA